jgi:hypothetical protein
VNSGDGMPILAKRPAPKSFGKQKFLYAFGKKHSPDDEANENHRSRSVARYYSLHDVYLVALGWA